jgi:TRAP-type uncharacterized transport system substrate-binding protein
MSDPLHTTSILITRLGPLAVALLIALVAVLLALPPHAVTIETGPVGGSYYETALKYKESMQRHGVTLRLVPDPDSLSIINDVNRQGSDIDIGFTAQAVARDRYPDAMAAGVVELQPLFTFYRVALGDVGSPSALRGKRIVMPPDDSATSEAALDLLALYGVTRSNTSISFMPLAEAVRTLKDGGADAGMFMLAPATQFILDMARDSDLRLLGLNEAKGITRHISHLTTAELSRGSYDIAHDIPPTNLELVAARVNVVVKKDISPAILYVLLEAMREVSHDPTLVSNAGDFPSVVGTDLLPHPLAVQYIKSGLPWIYEELPLWLAGLIDHYFVIGITIFICAEIYKKFADLGEMTHLLVEHVCLHVLAHIERYATRGIPITGTWLAALRLVEHVLFNTSRHRRSADMSRRIRSYMDRNPQT